MGFNHGLVLEGIVHPLRQEHPRPCLVPILMGVRPGQPVEIRVAAAKLQGQIVVIVVAGVAVDNLGTMNGILKHGEVAVPVGVGVDNQHILVKFLVELLGTGAAHIGVGTEPVLINTVNQIVVVVFRKAELCPQKHVKPQLVPPLFRGL